MPLYEYACGSCGAHTEVMQKVGAPPVTACPHCGGPVQKVLAAPALHFKGTGWYVTDYARKGNGGKPEGLGESKGSTESTGSKPADAASGNGQKP